MAIGNISVGNIVVPLSYVTSVVIAYILANIILFFLKVPVNLFWIAVSVAYAVFVILHLSLARSIRHFNIPSHILKIIKEPKLFVSSEYADAIEYSSGAFNEAADTNRTVLYVAAITFAIAAGISFIQGIGVA